MHIKISPNHKALDITSLTSALYPDNGQLTLKPSQGEPSECRITIHMPLEAYREIERARLFNLVPEIRGPFSGDEFSSETDIEIQLLLRPNVLPSLLEHATTADEALSHMIELSRMQHPLDNVISLDKWRATLSGAPPDGVETLLYTESWLCLSVQQTRAGQTVGFQTFWNYFPPARLLDLDVGTEHLVESIMDFVNDSLKANLSKILSPFKNANTNIGTFFEQLIAHLLTDDTLDSYCANSLYQSMVEYFREDGWTCTYDDDDAALGVFFRGTNGEWPCLGRVLPQDEQFVFYSLCPVNAPERKRTAVAELLTRANSGMVIGNFELDLDDGEICYKTSIDVRNDRISTALFQRLVYTNVLIMDKYLPAVVAVIEHGVTPADAVMEVEMNDGRGRSDEHDES